MSDNCRLALSEAGLDEVSIAKINKQLEDIVEQANAEGANPRAAIDAFLEKRANDLIPSKKARAVNLAKNRARIAEMESFKRPEKAMLSFLGRQITGNRTAVNIDRNISTWRDNLHSVHVQKIRKLEGRFDGIEKQNNLGDFDEQIFNLAEGGLKSADANPRALALYEEVYKPAFSNLHAEKVNLGFKVGFRKGYLGKQRHPFQQMLEMGDQKWKAIARKRFDFKKMGMEEAEAQEKFLNEFYTQITDQRVEYFGDVRDTMVQSKGISNKMEAERKIEFNNPSDRYNYNQEMGTGSLMENYLRTIEADSKSLGSAEVLGPSFNSNFENLMKEAKRMAAEQGEDSLTKFNKSVKKIERQRRMLLDPRDTDEANLWGKFADKLIKLNNMSKLGSALVSTVTDFPLGAAVLSASSGRNLLSLQKDVISETFKNFASKGRTQDLAFKMGVFADDVVHGLMESTDLNGKYSSTGWFDKGHTAFMNATGLPRQAKSIRVALAKLQSTALADSAHLDFKDLNAGLQQRLSNANIGDKEWSKIRNAVEEYGDGTKGINMESVLDLPSLSGLEKNKLARRVSAVLAETAELGSPTPRVAEDAIFKSMSPNSASGALLRFVAQYKSFSLSMFKTMGTIGRTGIQDGAPLHHANYGTMAATMAMATGWGYVALSAKDALKGRDFRDPTDPNTWKDSAVQSGTGLLLTDFLSTDYNNSFRSLAADIAGPSIGTLQDFITLAQSAGKGAFGSEEEKTKALRRAVDVVEKNTPAIPFTKALINQELFKGIHRTLNTGKDLSKRKNILDKTGIR